MFVLQQALAVRRAPNAQTGERKSGECTRAWARVRSDALPLPAAATASAPPPAQERDAELLDVKARARLARHAAAPRKQRRAERIIARTHTRRFD